MNLYFNTILDYAKRIIGDFALLHSSRNDDCENGIYCFLASKPVAIVTGDDPAILDQLGEGFWVGFMAYELFDAVEETRGNPYQLTPKIQFVRYASIIKIDTRDGTVTFIGEDPSMCDEALDPGTFNISRLSSNFTDAEYLDKVLQIKELILQGEIYEANLTRKFFGQIDCSNSLAIYLALSKLSPAQYGAYIRHGELSIISSSPELFLKRSGNLLTSQPIKGTCPPQAADNMLLDSKIRAENLIIVDLVRNDLSRICKRGSVTVPKLFHVTRYPHLAHLSSIIQGEILKGATLCDIVKATFPPGSMTGAPKINMYKHLTTIEGTYRGIYSGALGWVYEGEFCFSVVIRTIIIQGNYLEFQVGGAITIDSDPQLELEECNTKAAMILKSLGFA